MSSVYLKIKGGPQSSEWTELHNGCKCPRRGRYFHFLNTASFFFFSFTILLTVETKVAFINMYGMNNYDCGEGHARLV